MMIEMLIIAIIVIYIFIVNGKIDTSGIFSNNSKLCNLIKEKDYDLWKTSGICRYKSNL